MQHIHQQLCQRYRCVRLAAADVALTCWPQAEMRSLEEQLLLESHNISYKFLIPAVELLWPVKRLWCIQCMEIHLFRVLQHGQHVFKESTNVFSYYRKCSLIIKRTYKLFFFLVLNGLLKANEWTEFNFFQNTPLYPKMFTLPLFGALVVFKNWTILIENVQKLHCSLWYSVDI